MSAPVNHRNVTPLLNLLRNVFRGKKVKTNPLRFADEQAARTQPQPDLPGGPYAKISEIAYYARDGRREAQPPVVIVDLAQGGSRDRIPEPRTPGQAYLPA
ncbi:hypothetical protein QAD02_016934 [Eretmocerus hayati]|uniref:Uncharacterized protein n=1 Tax=Eretmocerus hayati TaxID=131215 RepID=A0ACC2PFB9_9HYME|nr:hypothetical protein QAD02_016934 [Eretmocerus hayati]